MNTNVRFSLLGLVTVAAFCSAPLPAQTVSGPSPTIARFEIHSSEGDGLNPGTIEMHAHGFDLTDEDGNGNPPPPPPPFPPGSNSGN